MSIFPYEIFHDLDGQPLDGGYVYIGEPNQNPITHPIAVSWDEAGLYPAAQPIRTIGGYANRNGNAGNIYPKSANFSLLIKNKSNAIIFNEQLAKTFFDAALELAGLMAFEPPNVDGFSVYLSGRTTPDDGGQGHFIWNSSDNSANVTNDPLHGIYVPPNSDLTGASGCWVRQYPAGTINVAWFGAIPSGADITAAMQAAFVLGAGQQIIGSLGAYYLTDGLVQSGQTIVTFPKGTVFDFHIPNNTTNCYSMSSSNYAEMTLTGVTIKSNNTGLDGLVITRGVPKFQSVIVKQSYRDSIALRLSGFDWVENMTWQDILISEAGRHPIAFSLVGTGETTGSPFINEALITQLEVRGIGKNFANANALNITFTGIVSSSAQKVSGLTILQTNLDAQAGASVAPVGDVILVTSNDATYGNIESLFIKGGGWESSSGSPPGGLRVFNSDVGVNVLSSTIIGVIPSNWGYGVSVGFRDGDDNYYVENNSGYGRGAYYPPAKTKSDGYSFRAQNGGLLGGFDNAPTAYRASFTLVASGNATIDIPISVLSPYTSNIPIFVTLVHKGYRNSGSTYSYGIYLVSVSNDGGTLYVHNWQLLTGGANLTYTFTASSVTFNIPVNGTLRVTVPGGANVGTGGTTAGAYCSASAMLTPLPSQVTSLLIK